MIIWQFFRQTFAYCSFCTCLTFLWHIRVSLSIFVNYILFIVDFETFLFDVLLLICQKFTPLAIMGSSNIVYYFPLSQEDIKIGLPRKIHIPETDKQCLFMHCSRKISPFYCEKKTVFVLSIGKVTFHFNPNA